MPDELKLSDEILKNYDLHTKKIEDSMGNFKIASRSSRGHVFRGVQTNGFYYGIETTTNPFLKIKGGGVIELNNFAGESDNILEPNPQPLFPILIEKDSQIKVSTILNLNPSSANHFIFSKDNEDILNFQIQNYLFEKKTEVIKQGLGCVEIKSLNTTLVDEITKFSNTTQYNNIKEAHEYGNFLKKDNYIGKLYLNLLYNKILVGGEVYSIGGGGLNENSDFFTAYSVGKSDKDANKFLKNLDQLEKLLK